MANLKEKPIMHVYIISHGGDLNENKHFEIWKLIIHGYKNLHASDLNKNEHYKKISKRDII